MILQASGGMGQYGGLLMILIMIAIPVVFLWILRKIFRMWHQEKYRAEQKQKENDRREDNKISQ